jgi:hypothetical protein
LSTISGASVTYTPDANFAGEDSFTFKASDANGSSASTTVNISVRGWHRIDTLGTAYWGDACNNNGVSVTSDGQKIAACASGNGQNGLFVSTDRGVTWSANRGLCDCVKFAPDGSRLVKSAGSTVSYSTDDGATWTASSITTSANLQSITVSNDVLSDGNNKVAVTDTSDFTIWMWIGNLWGSVNGGATLSALAPYDDNLIAHYSHDGSKLFLWDGLGGSPGLSLDQGATFDFFASTGGGEWSYISAATADLSKVFVNVDQYTIVYDTATESRSILPNPTNDPLPWRASTIAASSDGSVLLTVWGTEWRKGYLYRSIDAGANWTRMTAAGNIATTSWNSTAMSGDGLVMVAADLYGYIWVYR